MVRCQITLWPAWVGAVTLWVFSIHFWQMKQSDWLELRLEGEAWVLVNMLPAWWLVRSESSMAQKATYCRTMMARSRKHIAFPPVSIIPEWDQNTAILKIQVGPVMLLLVTRKPWRVFEN